MRRVLQVRLMWHAVDEKGSAAPLRAVYDRIFALASERRKARLLTKGTAPYTMAR